MNTVKIPSKYRYVYNEVGVPVWWEWCEQQFGNSNNSSYGSPATEHYWRTVNDNTMWFADPAHATWFLLRWS